MANWASQFSLPLGVADKSVLDTVVVSHGRAVATLLVTHHRDDLARSGEGLVEFILAWTNMAASFETVWDPAFGRAQLCMSAPTINPYEAAVRLALRLTETGHAGRWSATVPRMTLLFGGMVIRSLEHVWVAGDEHAPCVRFRVSTGDYVRCVFDPVARSWIAEGRAERLRQVGVTRAIFLFPTQTLAPAGDEEECFEGTHAVASIDDGIVRAFERGMQALAVRSPQYLPWIEQVLRGIMVCPADEQFRAVSGSAEDLPGIIHVSYPLEPLALAEIFIHECAHQYFYMLQRVGDVDDGTDQNRYWSPPIRMTRPLSRILMAYHALANVRLFYESVCSSHAIDDDVAYVEANQAEMDASIAALDVPLRGNRALTNLGRSIYEPLAESLAVIST